ncbi:MAG: hypothetical protein U0359_13250 [Byssovorax sp.]
MTSIYEELIVKLSQAETTDPAVEALAAEGDGALEELAAAMLDEGRPVRVREICAVLLGEIVPRGIDRLLDILEHAQGEEADLAAWGLRWGHDESRKEAILFGRLGHESSRVRANAARALRYIHVDLTTCDPRLIAALRDPDPSVRLDALRTMTHLAEAGLANYDITHWAPVRAAALEGASGTDAAIREAAIELLSHLEGRSTP